MRLSGPPLLFALAVCLSAAASDPPPTQVEIDAQIIEVEDEFENELGFEWGVGPVVSHYTNIENPENINVVGVNAFAGIDWLFHPFLSFYSHINLTQIGNGTNTPGGYNKIRILNLGVDAGLKLHILPRRKIDGFVLVGLDFGGNVSGVSITKQNGDKDKFRFDLTGNDNRTFAGATGGAGVTIRTDILDFTLQATVTGGLTLVDKNPPENTPRSVPFLAEIPVIIRFFGREKQRDRPNLLLFLTPEIIDDPVE